MKLYGLQNKEKSSLKYTGGEIKEGLLQDNNGGSYTFTRIA